MHLHEFFPYVHLKIILLSLNFYLLYISLLIDMKETRCERKFVILRRLIILSVQKSCVLFKHVICGSSLHFSTIFQDKNLEKYAQSNVE